MKVTFSEAFFKVHYTKGFRLTYPTPLPTTVAGMFGAMLGIGREEIREVFQETYFGAKVIKCGIDFSENVSYIQYKGGRAIKGVAQTVILHNPSYLIAMGDEDSKISDFYKKISNSIVYLPYGGQNEFFVEDLKVLKCVPLEESFLIENYAPQDLVENMEIREETRIYILPVKHKISENPYFYFIYRGRLKLKEKIPSADGIGLYKLSDFYYLPLKKGVKNEGRL